MDLLDLAIDATLKGAVSHYVRKSLEKIDLGLWSLVSSGNRDDIKRYITEKHLVQPVTELASQTLRSSFVIPAMPSTIATFEDRAELFQHVLQFGFNVSNKLQVDLVLPGSLHSRDTTICFIRNEAGSPNVAREGNRVNLPKSENYQSEVYIVPSGYEEAQAIFTDYKRKLVQHLENDQGYFSYEIVKSVEGWDNCRLTAMTAGSCYFQYVGLMKGKIQAYFAPEQGRVPIKDWSSGLREMFAAVAEVPNLGYLSDEQTKEINDAYELFKRLN
jgi:hypothetical protein